MVLPRRIELPTPSLLRTCSVRCRLMARMRRVRRASRCLHLLEERTCRSGLATAEFDPGTISGLSGFICRRWSSTVGMKIDGRWRGATRRRDHCSSRVRFAPASRASGIPPASIYWERSDVEGAIISLKIHKGISPELVGVLCHGLSCAPRARPASKAARI